jgi:multidrug resistance efflux pump
VAAGPNDDRARQNALVGQGVVCLGRVDVEGGLLNLGPLQPGAVVEILCYEGQTVRKDTELLKVNDEPFVKKAAEAEAGVQVAEAQLAQARQALEAFKEIIRQQQAALDGAKAKLGAAQAQLDQAERMKKLNFSQVSAEDIELAKRNVEGHKAAVTAEEAKLDQVRKSSPDAKVDEASRNVDFRKAQLEQAREALGRCTLRAPQDGTVLQLLATVGSQYGAHSQTPAVIFAPNGERFVRLEVDQEYASRISLGATATIHDETNVGPVYYGKVLRVGDAFLPIRNPHGPDFMASGSNNRVLEVIVSIEQNSTMPRIGQRMRATIGGAATAVR